MRRLNATARRQPCLPLSLPPFDLSLALRVGRVYICSWVGCTFLRVCFFSGVGSMSRSMRLRHRNFYFLSMSLGKGREFFSFLCNCSRGEKSDSIFVLHSHELDVECFKVESVKIRKIYGSFFFNTLFGIEKVW